MPYRLPVHRERRVNARIRRASLLVVLLVVDACAATDMTSSRPSTVSESWLCRTISATEMANALLAQAIEFKRAGDRTNASRLAREAFTSVSAHMSEGPPPTASFSPLSVLAWTTVAAYEISLADAIEPTLVPGGQVAGDASQLWSNLQSSLREARALDAGDTGAPRCSDHPASSRARTSGAPAPG